MPNSFTPQEIEQFLQEFFDVVGARQYVGARYVPIFGRSGEDTVEWDDTAPYEPLTVVMHEGISYVSRRYVPTGIQLTDTDYWVETYRFNAQVEQYRREVLGFQDQINDLRNALEDDYVPFPDPDTYPKYGTTGQVLTTLANGDTKWEDPVVPDEEATGEAVNSWLVAHPEATTTVQDGSVTNAKLADGTVRDSKLYFNGVLNTTDAIANALHAIARSFTESDAGLAFFQGTYVDGVLTPNTEQVTTHMMLLPKGVRVRVNPLAASQQSVIRYFTRAADDTYTQELNQTANNQTVNEYVTTEEGYFVVGYYNGAGIMPEAVTSTFTVEYVDTGDIDSLLLGKPLMQRRTDTVTDLNDCTTPGIYIALTTATNFPSSLFNQAGTLIVFSMADPLFVVQVFAPYSTNSETNTGIAVRKRERGATTWGDWHMLMYSANIAEEVGALPVVQRRTSTVTDFNDCVTPGIYIALTTAANFPSSLFNQAGTLIVFSMADPLFVVQVFAPYSTNSDTNTGIAVRKRERGATTWGDWHMLTYADADRVKMGYASDSQYWITFGDFRTNLIHVVDTDTDADLWNIDTIQTLTYDNVTMAHPEILSPIKLVGDTDFMGGVHGSETTTYLEVTVDGTKQTLGANLNVTGKTLIISMVSELRRADNQLHVFDRYVRVIITRNKIRISTTFHNISGGPLQVQRATNGGQLAMPVNQINSWSINNYISGTPPTQDIYKVPYRSKVNTMGIVNTILASITLRNLVGHELDTYRGFLQVFPESQPVYCKFYFDTIGVETEVSDGAYIAGVYEYEFTRNA